MYEEHSQPVISEEVPETIYSIPGKGIGVRAVSWTIDMIVLFLINYGVGIAIGMFIGVLIVFFGSDIEFVEDVPSCLDLIGGVILTLSYAVSFESLYGATIGKLILRMRVIKVDGTPCDFRSALVRGLYRYIDGLFFGIPAFLTMKSPKYQRLGDKSANTIVVNSNEEVVETRDWWWLIIAMLIYFAIASFIQVFFVITAIRSV